MILASIPMNFPNVHVAPIGKLFEKQRLRDHAFFKQAQFQSLLGDDFLQRPGFLSQILDLAAGRRTRGIPAFPASRNSFDQL